MTPTDETANVRASILRELGRRRHFVITSHARPDGDSIGSQVAMASALRALGKTVRIVNRDPVPSIYEAFPGTETIEVADAVGGTFDAAIVMECPDIHRPQVTGLEHYFLINIDHHLGNTLYGALNWYDPTAAACGEMVFELIEGLGVPLSLEIATHIYLCILTDTGSFHHSHMTARTFEICRKVVEAGVEPAAMARAVFDGGNLGRLRLLALLLGAMEVNGNGRVAVLHLENGMLERTGCTSDDTEGIVNLPLTAHSIQAVVFLKDTDVAHRTRVSLRSKDDLDVRAVATRRGGGGHKNAAGFTIDGDVHEVKRAIVQEILAAGDIVDAASASEPNS